ncbi:MAG: twin-arginine translocation signal domain-containing protein [Opitutaceae bacterium]|nr:twin-arginine translocation signal domain-containing protein [Opitutaceae bacterium]
MFDRRTFVKTMAAAGLGLAVAPSVLGAEGLPRRRRFVQVGTGSRVILH